VLLDDTDVIVAVNSYVIGQRITTCKATAFAYRTDQQLVIDWILAHAGPKPTESTSSASRDLHLHERPPRQERRRTVRPTLSGAAPCGHWALAGVKGADAGCA
jgi:hypothetical protein